MGKAENFAMDRVEMSPTFMIFKHAAPPPRTVKLTVEESTPAGVVVRASDREPVTEKNSLKFRVKPSGAVELWNRRYEEYSTDLAADQNR